MAEVGPHEPGYDAEIIINRNYLSSENVRARFQLYEFGEPRIDIEATAVEAVGLTGQESIVDIGAADGSLLQRLRVEFGHRGKLTGIEPNYSQVESATLWQPLDQQMVIQGLMRVRGKFTETYSPNFFDDLVKSLTAPPAADVELLEGTAHEIPLENNSADALFAMFMLYHVPPHKQPLAFAEFKRVLKDEGVFVMATSGTSNKQGHRLIEETVAEMLNIKKPAVMNGSFTTERAVEVVPQHFRHAYLLNHESEMVIDEPFKVECYLNSLRSLRDQFEPIPSVQDFEAILKMVISPVIVKAISNFGAYVDAISRSVIIASDRPLHLEDKNFEPIS